MVDGCDGGMRQSSDCVCRKCCSTLSSALLHRAGLTGGCLGPALLALTGMELGPFREEVGVCVLLPLDGRFREEVGAGAVGVFFMQKAQMNTKDVKDGMKK